MFNYASHILYLFFDLICTMFKGLEFSMYGIGMMMTYYAFVFVLWKLFWNWMNRFEFLKSAEVKRLETIIDLLRDTRGY